MTIPPLNEMNAFIRVAKLSSFRRASEELNLSASTLSHLIRSLEERLNARLLNRTTRSVGLTEAGQTFLAELSPLMANLSSVIERVQDTDREPRGSVRITTSDIAARIFAKKLDPKFHEKYPFVEIEVTAENRMIDIVAEGFDAGLRLYKSLPKDMISIRLTEHFRFIAVASPSYIKKNGQPVHPKDLLKHPCVRIRFNNGRTGAWEFEKGGKKQSIEVTGPITTNNPGVMIETALGGKAIAYVAEPLIEAELASGKLVTLLEGWSPPTPGIHFYYPKNRHMPSALRAVVDSLRSSTANRK